MCHCNIDPARFFFWRDLVFLQDQEQLRLSDAYCLAELLHTTNNREYLHHKTLMRQLFVFFGKLYIGLYISLDRHLPIPVLPP